MPPELVQEFKTNEDAEFKIVTELGTVFHAGLPDAVGNRFIRANNGMRQHGQLQKAVDAEEAERITVSNKGVNPGCQTKDGRFIVPTDVLRVTDTLGIFPENGSADDAMASSPIVTIEVTFKKPQKK